MSEKLDEIARACQRGLSDNPGWTARRQVAQIRAALTEQFLAENREQEARAKKAEAEVERTRAALGECYSDLCELEPLLTDTLAASSTEQARLLSSAISWCKYLKQPEWIERVDQLLNGEGEK